METFLSMIFKHDFSSSMTIWILFSALVYGVYVWFNPSEDEGWWKTRGFFEPLDSDFLVLIIWLLITYYLKSKDITFS